VTTSGGVPRDAPTTGVTRVRVRQETPEHHHHDTLPALSQRPEWIVVALPPVRPDALTLCDTEWLWRIPDEELERLGGDSSRGHFYVCEHQVEID
jgi:hypothetical protein